jgi:hypothetical protein
VLGRVERQLFFNGGQLVFVSSSDRFDSLREMMIPFFLRFFKRKK